MAVAAAAVLLAGGATAWAQNVDALLNKLVEKGILTVKEADELKVESDKGITAAHRSREGLPEWVTGLQFTGDFRGRFDGMYPDVSAIEDRNRLRFRLRFGAIASLTENWEVGLRLASTAAIGGDGGGDPVSTNETLGNNANRKPVGIDWAYARWRPLNTSEWTVSLAFGKFENPFALSEMVFDQDYTPEGFSEQITYRLNADQKLRLNLGQFWLEEVPFSGRDAYMFGAQGRWDANWNPSWRSAAGVAGLTIVNPETLTTSAVPNVGRGNTRNEDGVLLSNFDVLVVDASVTRSLESFPFYRGAFPIRMAGEFIYNFGAGDENVGFGFGPTFGGAGRKGQWEISYKYKHLEADAMYEETVDSDYGAFYPVRPPDDSDSARYPSYQSGTNVRGHVFRLSYSPHDALTLSATYSLTELIVPELVGDIPRAQTSGGRFIFDAVWKF